ncbi:hypothetical protein SEA_CIRCINUS_250 [Streptomyces phage Circinus]|uniref:Uncharacterized protein n=1 Tax=Streptomyces phage Circinus TaxID=2562189 RepID=A0A4D6E1F1_9CAUD|nr:hypothetical protein SEA_CIRCINUS_5 [Streptomyces phage Circinus]QBZ72503.1 hypothetical protein SEA_CIRCINUS_250 [Streptomyces phage Circinus]
MRILAALALLPVAGLFLCFVVIFVVGAVAIFGAIILGILFGAFG